MGAVPGRSTRSLDSMLKRYWFATDTDLGYGVTAASRTEAESLLRSYGYPREGQSVVKVVENIEVSALDANHVLPSSGPVAVRGIWFPRHNV